MRAPDQPHGDPSGVDYNQADEDRVELAPAELALAAFGRELIIELALNCTHRSAFVRHHHQRAGEALPLVCVLTFGAFQGHYPGVYALQIAVQQLCERINAGDDVVDIAACIVALAEVAELRAG